MLRRLLRLLRDLPMRYKVLAGGVLPLLLSVGMGGILATYHLQRVLVTQVDQQLRITSTLIAGMVETAAEASIRNHLRSLAETYRSHAEHLNGQALKGVLTDAEARRRCIDLLLAQRVGQTGYLYVIDPEGWVQAHPSQQYVGTNTAHFPYVRKQLDLREGYMEYSWANPGDPVPRPKALYEVPFPPWNWIISASSYRAEFASLLNVGDFREPIQSIHLGNGGDPFILDLQGRLLLRARHDGSGLEDPTEPHAKAFLADIVRQRRGEVTGYLAVPGHATPRLVRCHFREIPDLGWIVGATFDLEEAFLPLRLLRRGLLALSILSVLLVIPLTFWVSGRITFRLSHLARAFEGGYRVGVRVPETSRDEIGRLSAGFNAFVSALEHAQAELRESEARLRGIFEHAAEGIVQSTPEGRLIQVNPAMARLFGYGSAEALLQEPAGVLYADKADRERLMHTLLRGEVSAEETLMRRKDGTDFWCSVKAVGIRNERGTLTLIEALVEDVTERRQRREELERLVALRTRELEEAVALAERATLAKSEFLSSMSHELRTPLNAILLYSELILEEAREAGFDALGEDLEKIRQAGDHLLGLINNILDLAKIEAGRVDLTLKAVTLPKLMSEVRFTLQPLVERRGNHLVIDCPEALPPVRADLLRLRQVLINLGSNAAKFTDGGEIAIRCDRADDGLCIEVKDTGAGMSPAELALLFRAFQQTSLGRERGGTGLGLTISHRLTELMGGRLTVESALGAGTTFRVWLPGA